MEGQNVFLNPYKWERALRFTNHIKDSREAADAAASTERAHLSLEREQQRRAINL